MNLSRRNDLSPGDPLRNDDEVTRYCSPDKYDLVNCEPEIGAFQEAQSESGVSIDRLHHFVFTDREQAVDMIRQEHINEPRHLSEEGRFVLFKIGTVKRALMKMGLRDVAFTFTPATRECHADIENFPTDPLQSRTAAAKIKRLITHTYPGKVPPTSASPTAL